MTFQPATTSLPDRTSLRTFLDTSDGVIYHSKPIDTFILLQNTRQLAKNVAFSYVSDRDLIVIGAYFVFASDSNNIRLTFDLFDPTNARLLSRAITFPNADGYLVFPNYLILPRNHRFAITPAEIIDKLTLVTQETFVQTIKI